MKNIEKTIKKAENLIPGGVSLFSKKPQNFLQKGWPSYFIKTDKVYVWDLNKKKYLDMFFGVGTNTLGYNNKEVDKAVIEFKQVVRLLSDKLPNISRNEVMILSKAHHNLAVCYLKKEWLDAAEQEARNAFKLMPIESL